jgi:hypothetical protein
MPLWVFEGMSDYMTGYWRPLDIMTGARRRGLGHRAEDERDGRSTAASAIRA